MAKDYLGERRACPACGAKFFDLNRRPCECPKCSVRFDPIEPKSLKADDERSDGDSVAGDGEASAKIGGAGFLFVSHHSSEDGAFAMRLASRLEHQGSQCWIAPRDIKPGANWNREIMEAVRQCSAMLVVISDAALKSDFVQAEVHRALNLKKTVVPLLLSDGLNYTDIDARLETKQRIDWWRVGDDAFSSLVRVVGKG